MPGFVQRKLIGKPQVSTLENLPLFAGPVEELGCLHQRRRN